MPRRKSAAYMSAGEQIAGTVLFVIYLLVLPFVTAPLFRLVGGLLGVTISSGLQNILYYYILFAATLIIFHGFLGRTSRNFADNLGGACKFMAIGLVALYGLNELAYRLTRLVVPTQTNLNDTTISAQIEDAPHMTLLIVIFLAPFVEEVLFRGLVFGNLRRQPPPAQPPGGLRSVLRPLRLPPRVAVRRGEPGHHLFSADAPVPGAGAGAGLGL